MTYFCKNFKAFVDALKTLPVFLNPLLKHWRDIISIIITDVTQPIFEVHYTDALSGGAAKA